MASGPIYPVSGLEISKLKDAVLIVVSVFCTFFGVQTTLTVTDACRVAVGPALAACRTFLQIASQDWRELMLSIYMLG